jgi:DNA repair protein RadC
MQTNMDFLQGTDSQGLLPLGATHFEDRRDGRSRIVEEIKCAYSIKTSRVKEPDFPYRGQQFVGTMDLLRFVRSLENSDVEKMLTLYLDGQNQLICIQITRGTVNQAYVYPREIIRHAILVGSCAMILVHNHPSGHERPSEADIRITRSIQEVAKLLEIVVHDHMIVGAGGRFFSFREEGMM